MGGTVAPYYTQRGRVGGTFLHAFYTPIPFSAANPIQDARDDGPKLRASGYGRGREPQYREVAFQDDFRSPDAIEQRLIE